MQTFFLHKFSSMTIFFIVEKILRHNHEEDLVKENLGR